MRRILDRPIEALWGRTFREVLLICGGLAVIAWSIAQPRTNPWHLSFYVAATAAFAVRFFAARVVAVGFILCALTLSLAEWRAGGPPFWSALTLLPGLALLISSDLRERFDRAPGSGWRRNPWRAIDRRHWALWCAVGYLLGILANLYLLPWRSELSSAGAWPLWIVGGVYLSIGLLFLGRALAFVVAAAVGSAALITAAPLVAAAERQIDGLGVIHDGLFWTRPGFVLVAAIAGFAVVALAAPYAWLVLRRAARS